MCGLTAIVSFDGAPVPAGVIERMTSILTHRGPDEDGHFLSGSVGFGFRRLSILDLSPAGHQPMVTDDGQVAIVFNGEIYNYVELRRELEGLGHRFRSTGDTEVLLRAYCQWGAACLDRLNGMWAFLVFDQRRGVVFGSRDRFGIKPLFMHRRPECMVFASEIKAIRASGLWSGGIHWPVAAHFLMRSRLDLSDETFYAGIRQVAPATAFELKLDGSYREWRYWRLEDVPPVEATDPAAAFAELFEDSMRLHMRSDVPVGVHLSGGLDSTSIICATARLRAAAGATGPLVAFCYQAPEFDESAYIADTLRQTGATMFSLETSAEKVWNDLTRMLWYQDEPVHSMTAVIGYQLMRLTAQHGLRVILNGQGADETLAGYPNYFKDYWHTLLGEGLLTQAWSEIGDHAAVHGGSQARLLFRQLRHLLQGKLQGLAGYRRLAAWNARRNRPADDWFAPELAGQLPAGAPVASDLNGALRWSIRHDPLPLYLRVEDRNSMAHSVEARVPFLDYRLVSYAHGLPANWKMRGPSTKFLLREAMRGRIPESVRERSVKFGFPVPLTKWLAGPLYEVVREQITARRARERGIYRVDNIVRDLDRWRRGELDAGARLFRVAQFEAWSSVAERAPEGDGGGERHRETQAVF